MPQQRDAGYNAGMDAQVHIFDPTTMLPSGGKGLATLDADVQAPLRWAAWHPDGSWCLLVGNRGTAVRYLPDASGNASWEPIDTGTKRNLRGVAFSPDGKQALLVGNRGAVLLYDDASSIQELPSPTSENLRRVAWRPQGDMALVVGNAGTVLRYDPSASLRAVPGDRAHTLRAVAWRPDGAYALVGAYASRWAGYPRPHPLYQCDGTFLQALVTSDEEDDFVAVDWHPDGKRALVAGYAFAGDESDGGASNKLLTYDGRGFSYQMVEHAGSLLGAAWHPGGEYALLCGEGGMLLTLRASDGQIETLDSGTNDNLVGPFWRPDGSSALLLRGPQKRVYTV
ncbi:MAG: WD40 repeat domain-containing protein [Chloroflexi bacterium]|nr:WD40 repeat domain-containing protein [Chloroflexota bacterium]